jgi:hypothetical protein
MTPRQKALARHALGLEDGRTKSYRNRFYCGPNHPAWPDWISMCVAGEAKRGPKEGNQSSVRFSLTHHGAATRSDW